MLPSEISRPLISVQTTDEAGCSKDIYPADFGGSSTSSSGEVLATSTKVKDSSYPNEDSVVRICARAAEYLGSFAVAGVDQTTRADYVRTQLSNLKHCSRSKPVLLVVSLAGVKVCSLDGKTVHMAHALRRISYATCDPENALFSFLAREPKGHFSLQYCHSFRTNSACQAEQLNSILGNAFRMAYAAQFEQVKNKSKYSWVKTMAGRAAEKLHSRSLDEISELKKYSFDMKSCSAEFKRSSQTSSGSSNTLPSSASPPPLPERFDSLGGDQDERTTLNSAPWFQAGIPREIALEVLAQEPVGAFMVRESTTKLGCYALSLRVPRDFQPSGIAHYLILKTTRGYKIKGFTKEFPSLVSLITHHSVMPELLPCPLALSRQHNPSFSSTDSNFADMDPDYSVLADFRKIMADLN